MLKTQEINPSIYKLNHEQLANVKNVKRFNNADKTRYKLKTIMKAQLKL